MIKLGRKVRDKITGMEGIAISRIEYLNGCVQYAVQPLYKKGSTEMPAWNIDQEQLEVVGKKVKIENRPTGGPMSKV